MVDDLDRILSGEPNISPSSGFVPKVMVAVHREVSIPAPLSFPWLQVAPGLALGAGALIALFIIVIMRFGGSGAVTAGPMPRVFVAIAEEANSIGLAWIALGLVASLVPMRLVVART